MKLRSHLLVVTLATLVPMALFAIGGAYLLAEREREAFRLGAIERARAVMTAIDSELRGSIRTLEAMAALPSFDGDDPEAFRPDALRILPTQPAWLNVVVSNKDGRPVMNARVPRGQPLPETTQQPNIRRVAEQGVPGVGEMTLAPLFKRPVYTVRVPVVREAKVRYVLTAVLDPAAVKALLDRQKFPAEWAVGVFDTRFQFVARNREPPGAARFASTSLQQTLANSKEGWNEGTILEGTRSFRAYTTSQFSGWAISIAMPKSEVTRAGTEAVFLLSVGVLLAIFAGGTVGLLLWRRITGPMASLVAAAPTLGQGGEPAPLPDSEVDEVRELTHALHEAGRAIRQREARQKEAEDALRAADRSKDEFLAMLGHELRNPLATLSTAAELLKIGRHQDGIVENAQALIARQTGHMSHLVDDLLEVGRVTSGKIRLETEPLDLAQAARRVLDTWAEGGRLARHRVERALEPAWIMGDPSRIEQIVSNLLDNAIKYTPAGGRIEVRVGREDGQAGRRAVLEVADDGQGLPPELMARVFDLFVQGPRSLAREQGGLGIGLTLVRRLAELHDGTAQVASAGPGRGAVFTVAFPAILPPEARPGGGDRAASASDAKSTILIVEDNADARESLAQLLRLAGHEVSLAANGAEGLRLGAAQHPDVALVDIGLPDMTGYDVARGLRSSGHGEQMHIVAVTGYGRDEDRQRAADAGFDEQLTKPVEFDRLMHMLAARSKRRL
jgi:signal transduction histidine kinase/ActR/RegA family two-component response regulator